MAHLAEGQQVVTVAGDLLAVFSGALSLERVGIDQAIKGRRPCYLRPLTLKLARCRSLTKCQTDKRPGKPLSGEAISTLVGTGELPSTR